MARRNENNLTDKWQVFADSYLADPELNATKAYKAVYPNVSQRTAEANSSELLKKTEVAEYIAKAMAERSERTKIDADYVLQRLVEVDQMDIADILDDEGRAKPISQWPEVWRQNISGLDLLEIKDADDVESVVKKIKWPDKTRNREMLGRHVAVQAFNDKSTIEVVDKAGLLAKARARAQSAK